MERSLRSGALGWCESGVRVRREFGGCAPSPRASPTLNVSSPAFYHSIAPRSGRRRLSMLFELNILFADLVTHHERRQNRVKVRRRNFVSKFCPLNINLYSVLASGHREQKNNFCCVCRPFCKTARINNSFVKSDLASSCFFRRSRACLQVWWLVCVIAIGRMI